MRTAALLLAAALLTPQQSAVETTPRPFDDWLHELIDEAHSRGFSDEGARARHGRSLGSSATHLPAFAPKLRARYLPMAPRQALQAQLDGLSGSSVPDERHFAVQPVS